MKLLIFPNRDGPVSGAPLLLDAHDVLSTVPPTVQWAAGSSYSSAKNGSSKGTYYFVGDDGRVEAVDEVRVMELQRPTPQRVTEEHVFGVDFRNKAGAKLDAKRSEFGRTFANASRRPAQLNETQTPQQQQKSTSSRKRERGADGNAGGEATAAPNTATAAPHNEPPHATTTTGASSKQPKEGVSSKKTPRRSGKRGEAK